MGIGLRQKRETIVITIDISCPCDTSTTTACAATSGSTSAVFSDGATATSLPLVTSPVTPAISVPSTDLRTLTIARLSSTLTTTIALTTFASSTPAPKPSPDSTAQENTSAARTLSTPAIIGIVFGSVLGFIGILAAVRFFSLAQQSQSRRRMDPDELPGFRRRGPPRPPHRPRHEHRRQSAWQEIAREQRDLRMQEERRQQESRRAREQEIVQEDARRPANLQRENRWEQREPRIFRQGWATVAAKPNSCNSFLNVFSLLTKSQCLQHLHSDVGHRISIKKKTFLASAWYQNFSL